MSHVITIRLFAEVGEHGSDLRLIRVVGWRPDHVMELEFL